MAAGLALAGCGGGGDGATEPDAADGTVDVGHPDASGCTSATQCEAEVSPGACEVAVCREDGTCGVAPAEDGTSCDDGDACSVDDQCTAGTCGGGGDLGCDDANPCTADACDPASGCTHEQRDECQCLEDGDCAGFDTPGLCDGSLVCDEGQCAPDPASVEPCDTSGDGACEETVCDTDTGQCVAEPLSDTPCDDGNPCNGADVCQAGTCTPGDAQACEQVCELTGEAGETVACPVGLARLGEASPPAVGLSFAVGWDPDVAALAELRAVRCVDGHCASTSIPTEGNALKASGHTVSLTPSAPGAWAGQVGVDVEHVTAPDTALNDVWIDGDEVTGGEPDLFVLVFDLSAAADASAVLLSGAQAVAAGGQVLTSRVVDDLLVTTDEGCGGYVCWDGDPCTADACDEGACSNTVAAGAPCDDGNPCTVDDQCGDDGACGGGTPADEGAACTGEDRCDEVGTCDGAGTCVLDGALDVTCEQPGSDCVAAACDPTTGECVTSALPGGSCDDGDACTGEDICGADGTCGGEPLSCDDGVGCTVDACDPASGCTSTPDHGACDDGNPCTDDVCTGEGCAHGPTTAACDDGDPCTTDDACQAGACTGAPAPACGCDTTADCAPLEDGDLCNGTYVCQAGTCAVDPATVITCPADGFQCETGWTCDPATGACEGEPMACDDGEDCTADSCSPTKGCEHALTPGCAIGALCELSGSAGETVTCDLRVARGASADPAPSGGDLKLTWDGARAALDNLEDEFCVGPACFPFDVVLCEEDGTGCSTQKLEPSGHDVVVVPEQKADWGGWLSLLLFHTGSAGEPITDAVLQGDGTVAGEPLVLTLRFTLLADVDAGDPVRVEVSDQHLNPPTGLDMSVTIETVDGQALLVATSP